MGRLALWLPGARGGAPSQSAYVVIGQVGA